MNTKNKNIKKQKISKTPSLYGATYAIYLDGDWSDDSDNLEDAQAKASLLSMKHNNLNIVIEKIEGTPICKLTKVNHEWTKL